MSKYFSAYRSATYLLLLYCTGHTAGGMLAQRSLGAESDAVFASMRSVHFVFNGATCTWYGFWFGFGLLASVFLLLSAGISWQLDRVPTSQWPAVSRIAWMLVASSVCNAVLSWAYFFAGPGVFATLITVLLAVGTWRKDRAAGSLATT